MSLFKAREWWSNNSALSRDNSLCGVQNPGCLAVDRVGTWTASDCLVLGDNSTLRIYKPEGEYQPAHLLLESELEYYIVQVTIGKFMAAANDNQVLVLHPYKYTIYSVQKKEGHTEFGDQNILTPVMTHSFKQKSYSSIHGYFGNIKNRELVCVQSLEGTFSFFDQEVMLFSCSFDDIIFPGPFDYIKSGDSFIIHKTNWILEIYSYLQMSEFGISGQRQTNKKPVPQWIYNPGEEIYALQVIQTSNNFSSIIALGERYLYCLQDNGLLKFMKKFDFMPICFHAYLIGWYYEPNARLLIMVASEDSKLLIYENTTLLWACQLFFTPITVSRCFLKGLPGGIVILSEEGIVNCCYLGTEPDLSGSMPIMQNDNAKPESVQKELEEVELIFKKITENEDLDDDISIEDIIKVSITVNNCVTNLHDDLDSVNTLHLIQCPVVVNLTFKDPSIVKNVQISYYCTPPFICSETIKSLDSVATTEIVETQIFVSFRADVSDFYLKALVTFTDDVGRIRTAKESAVIPFNLFAVPSPPPSLADEFKCKLRLDSLGSDAELFELFSDFSKEELEDQGATSRSLTFATRATRSVITITRDSSQYTIQAENYSHMSAIVLYLMAKLKKHEEQRRKKNPQIRLSGKLNLDLFQSFVRSIEVHASMRKQLQQHEEELSVLHAQFTLIQRKLLVQYGSLPPGDCDCLEFLMKDTYQRISNTVQGVIEGKDNVHRAGCALVSVGRLVVLVFELMKADTIKIELIKEAFALNSLYEDYQEWEEAVSQSISHILPALFGKSGKDNEKLAAVTEQGILNTINLKRFLKQTRTLLERMLNEVPNQNDEGTVHRDLKSTQRVEELVDTI